MFLPFPADPDTALDEQTWQDLLLEAYEDALAQGTSIFGRQVLHHRLRAGLNDAQCAALGARLRGLLADPARVALLGTALRPLRHAETEVAGLLFGGEAPQAPPWARLLRALPLLLLVSLALLAMQLLGWMATITALVPLMALQISYHRRIEQWNHTLGRLRQLVRRLEPAPLLENGARGVPGARLPAQLLPGGGRTGRRRDAGTPYGGPRRLVLVSSHNLVLAPLRGSGALAHRAPGAIGSRTSSRSRPPHQRRGSGLPRAMTSRQSPRMVASS